jgi:hypothetical protein
LVSEIFGVPKGYEPHHYAHHGTTSFVVEKKLFSKRGIVHS